MLKYGIINPADGQYTYADTPDEAANILSDRLIEFFKHYAGGTLLAFIDVDDNGAETWFNLQGQYDQAQEQIEAGVRKAAHAFLLAEVSNPPATPNPVVVQGAQTL